LLGNKEKSDDIFLFGEKAFWGDSDLRRKASGGGQEGYEDGLFHLSGFEKSIIERVSVRPGHTMKH
jgi:hypothetical protein